MSLTQEEKIDAIYEMMKRSESRARWHTFFKIIFWITMLGYSYYVMVYTLPNLIQSFMPNLPSMSQDGDASSLEAVLENPEVKKLYERYLQK